jgi:hypothetical protein
MAKPPKMTRMAQEIEGHLSAVRQIVRQPAEAEFARSNLTAAQRSVMRTARFRASWIVSRSAAWRGAGPTPRIDGPA